MTLIFATHVIECRVYEEHEKVPYPSLYLVSFEGSKYKIEEILCIGNIDGDIDCKLNWDS